MAKKEDKRENATRSSQDKPKILLKPKEKEPPTPQISIASRPSSSSLHIESNASGSSDPNIKTQFNKNHIASNATSSSSTSKEPTITVLNENRSTESKIPAIAKPISIISDYYQIQNHTQDFLIETNCDFFVVGIVGTQQSGKSVIANMLAIHEDYCVDETKRIMNMLNGHSGVFQTGTHSKDSIRSSLPCTEGIQMYITKHRTILLDCSPVLCNPYKKDAILSELDDLKMLIFLLSVCNLVIVVEDSGFDMHLLRLIHMAENMKIDAVDKDPSESRYTPNILFFKNKCGNCDFLVESKQRTNNLYRAFFYDSDMKITNAYAARFQEKQAMDEENVNLFYFPFIEENCKPKSSFLKSFLSKSDFL